MQGRRGDDLDRELKGRKSRSITETAMFELDLQKIRRVKVYFHTSYFIYGGDEESRTPVRTHCPMNLSERSPC